MKTCNECMYGQRPNKGEDMVCFRFPPTVVVSDELGTTVLPEVHEDHWCGEFLPMPAVKPKPVRLAS